MENKIDLAFVAVTLGIVGIIGIVAMVIFSRRQEPILIQPTPMQEIKSNPIPIEMTEKKEEFVKTYPRRPKTVQIQNPILNKANRWYEINIPENILAWSLRLREDQDLLYSYDPSQATYATLPAGETLTEDTSPNRGINAIYVSCATAGVTVEFEIWTDGYY
jgi:hypothetical protein